MLEILRTIRNLALEITLGKIKQFVVQTPTPVSAIEQFSNDCRK